MHAEHAARASTARLRVPMRWSHPRGQALVAKGAIEACICHLHFRAPELKIARFLRSRDASGWTALFKFNKYIACAHTRLLWQHTAHVHADQQAHTSPARGAGQCCAPRPVARAAQAMKISF